MNKIRNTKLNIFNDLDKWIFLPVVLLLIIGIFAVFSASTRIDEKYDLLFKKHLIFCTLSLFLIFFLSKLSLKNLIILSIFFFLLSFAMLTTTIFFFSETKGASRWIKIFGFSFQPSEVLKPSFVIISSLLLSRYKTKGDLSFLINSIIFVLISILLLKQPDFGMFLLIASVWLIQIFNTNINLKFIFIIISSFLLVFVLSYLTLDHVRFRINNFFFSNIGDNYQITKSLESFANGGFFGQGLGNGVISKNLPDAHSDFIYALIGEEFGFLTVLFIILLYMTLYLRIFIIAHNTTNFFILNSIIGLINIVVFQAIINISSSLNILPTKGMTLPLISYGGSSLISNSIIVGFILVLVRILKNG